jgi:hypothetical protein
MNIHQLNVQYDERQDRLQVRVKTVQEQEVRLWLTRRIGVKLVEPLMTTVSRIEALDPAVTVADEESRKILVHLKQEDFLQKADWSLRRFKRSEGAGCQLCLKSFTH